MGARRIGRERALQALFQLDQAEPRALPTDALAAAWASTDEDPKDPDAQDPEAQAFARELVDGVREHLAEIDALIESHSHHWRLDRMQRVDRNVLRLGVYELTRRADIPRKVTINEAIELGKKYGNEESAAFINGLLDRVAIAVNKP